MDEKKSIIAFYAMTIDSEPVWRFEKDPSILKRILSRINRDFNNVITVNLRWVAVETRLQRRGIGTLLMGKALDDFREIVDKTGVSALTLKPINEYAAEFYGALGFLPYGQENPKRMFLPAEDILNLE